jgi:hypothetical protein
VEVENLPTRWPGACESAFGGKAALRGFFADMQVRSGRHDFTYDKFVLMLQHSCLSDGGEPPELSELDDSTCIVFAVSPLPLCKTTSATRAPTFVHLRALQWALSRASTAAGKGPVSMAVVDLFSDHHVSRTGSWVYVFPAPLGQAVAPAPAPAPALVPAAAAAAVQQPPAFTDRFFDAVERTVDTLAVAPDATWVDDVDDDEPGGAAAAAPPAAPPVAGLARVAPPGTTAPAPGTRGDTGATDTGRMHALALDAIYGGSDITALLGYCKDATRRFGHRLFLGNRVRAYLVDEAHAKHASRWGMRRDWRFAAYATTAGMYGFAVDDLCANITDAEMTALRAAASVPQPPALSRAASVYIANALGATAEGLLRALAF